MSNVINGVTFTTKTSGWTIASNGSKCINGYGTSSNIITFTTGSNSGTISFSTSGVIENSNTYMILTDNAVSSYWSVVLGATDNLLELNMDTDSDTNVVDINTNTTYYIVAYKGETLVDVAGSSTDLTFSFTINLSAGSSSTTYYYYYKITNSSGSAISGALVNLYTSNDKSKLIAALTSNSSGYVSYSSSAYSGLYMVVTADGYVNLNEFVVGSTSSSYITKSLTNAISTNTYIVYVLYGSGKSGSVSNGWVYFYDDISGSSITPVYTARTDDNGFAKFTPDTSYDILYYRACDEKQEYVDSAFFGNPVDYNTISKKSIVKIYPTMAEYIDESNCADQWVKLCTNVVGDYEMDDENGCGWGIKVTDTSSPIIIRTDGVAVTTDTSSFTGTKLIEIYTNSEKNYDGVGLVTSSTTSITGTIKSFTPSVSSNDNVYDFTDQKRSPTTVCVHGYNSGVQRDTQTRRVYAVHSPTASDTTNITSVFVGDASGLKYNDASSTYSVGYCAEKTGDLNTWVEFNGSISNKKYYSITVTSNSFFTKQEISVKKGKTYTFKFHTYSEATYDGIGLGTSDLSSINSLSSFTGRVASCTGLDITSNYTVTPASDSTYYLYFRTDSSVLSTSTTGYEYGDVEVTVNVIVPIPEADEGLVYNGYKQTGFETFLSTYANCVTISGQYVAIDAGSYSATFSLNEGYVWSDSSTGDKTVSWSIGSSVLDGYINYTIEEISEIPCSDSAEVTSITNNLVIQFATVSGYSGTTINGSVENVMSNGESLDVTNWSINLDGDYLCLSIPDGIDVGTSASYDIMFNLFTPATSEYTEYNSGADLVTITLVPVSISSCQATTLTVTQTTNYPAAGGVLSTNNISNYFTPTVTGTILYNNTAYRDDVDLTDFFDFIWGMSSTTITSNTSSSIVSKSISATCSANSNDSKVEPSILSVTITTIKQEKDTNTIISTTTQTKYEIESLKSTASSFSASESYAYFTADPKKMTRYEYTWSSGDITYSDWEESYDGGYGTWQSNADWIILNDTAYEHNMNFTVTANTSASRTGTVTYTYYDQTATITISQAVAYYTLTIASGSVTAYTLTITASDGTVGDYTQSTTNAQTISVPYGATYKVTWQSGTNTESTSGYTVTWNGNGGSSPSATTTPNKTRIRNANQPNTSGTISGNVSIAANTWGSYGSYTYGAIGTLPTSTRTGYTFNGWYTAISGGTQITTRTRPTSNVTYYAHWTANTIRVNFDANGGSLPGTGSGKSYVDITYDTAKGSYPSITLPTYARYTFNGYYTATTGGTQYYNASGNSVRTFNLTTTTTLYAQWTANTVAIPTAISSLTYNGSAQTGIDGYVNTKMTFSGDVSGTNAGSYSATFTIGSNYMWSDGTIEDKTVSWSIARNPSASVSFANGTYTGSSITGVEGSYVTLSGTTSATNVGSYTAYATPTSNYAWSDETYAKKTIIWAIYKAASTLPTTWSGSSTTYHNTASVTATGASGGTLNYRTSDDKSTWSSWTTTKPSRTEIGTTYVQCYVKGDSNHNDSSTSTTVSLTILQATDASCDAVLASVTTYTGSSQNVISTISSHGCSSFYLGFGSSDTTAPTSWVAASTSITQTNAGTYYIWKKATPDSNHSNTISATYVGSVTIPRKPSSSVSYANKTYTGNAQTGVTGSNVTLSGTTSATNAGSYTAYATPTSNYAWSDGTTTKKTISWTINKAAGYATATTSDRTYTGNAQTIASIKTNSGSYYFGFGSSSTVAPTSWGTANTAAQATNAGTYYVWVKCDASTNYNAVSATYVGAPVIQKATPTNTITVNSGVYTGSAYTCTFKSSVSGTVYETYDGTTPSTSNYQITKSITANTETTIDTATNVGSWTVKTYFVPTDTTNYNTVSSTKTGWSITRKPSATASVITGFTPDSSNTKYYTGSSQTGVTGSCVSWSGTTQSTNAGDFTATATPTSNYAWSDGTTSSKTFNWRIQKATPTNTLSVESGVYKGSAYYCYFTSTVAGTVYETYNGSTPSATSYQITKSISASTKTSIDSATNVGSWTVKTYFVPTDTTNYNSVSKTLTGWSVTARKVQFTATNQSMDWTGSALTALATATLTKPDTTYYDLVSGHTATFTCSGSQTAVGSSTKTLSSVVIKSGSTDVSANYTIEKVNGTLTVNNVVTKHTQSASIGSGFTAAGGSATLTAKCTRTWADGTTDTVNGGISKVEFDTNGNGNSRFTIASSNTTDYTRTISHSSMGTTATTDTVKVKVTFVDGHTATASASVSNSVTSSTLPLLAGINWDKLIPAGGGTATPSFTYSQVRTYASGSTSTVSSGATITYTPAKCFRLDPEFYNGVNSINKYDNASSGKVNVVRITSGYPTGIPNKSGAALKITHTGTGTTPGMGGWYFGYYGSASQTYICTFDAYIPSGYTLNLGSNSTGTGTSREWMSPQVGTGKWQTYSIKVVYGTGTVSNTFFFYLTGTPSSYPVVWYLADATVCQTNGISSSLVNTSTGAVTLSSRGTTTGNATVNELGAVLITISLNGATGQYVSAPTQQANALTELSLTLNKDTIAYGETTSPKSVTATYTSGSTQDVTNSATYTSGDTSVATITTA